MNIADQREQNAARLLAAEPRLRQLEAFIGLDGFVDDILHIVDKRESAQKYTRLSTIEKLAARFAAAAGKSTNIELVSQMLKLGGNGPIMANALSCFGVQVSYLGTLGFPNLHPVFADFAKRAKVHSIAEPGYTEALEFEDGKIMMGKHQSLGDMTWENIGARFGVDRFTACTQASALIGFLNWTMLPALSDIWAAIERDVCPALTGPRRLMFVDLCDPEKRTQTDIRRALELVAGFQRHFDVILGLNEKESCEIGATLGLDTRDHSAEGLSRLATEILKRVPVDSVVVHPTAYALAAGADGVSLVQGPFTPKPKITTGAGDHFNAGFCLGRLAGLDNTGSLISGVSTSGFYVRTAKSPSIADIAGFMREWPQ
jgi:hypothetical protein